MSDNPNTPDSTPRPPEGAPEVRTVRTAIGPRGIGPRVTGRAGFDGKAGSGGRAASAALIAEIAATAGATRAEEAGTRLSSRERCASSV